MMNTRGFLGSVNEKFKMVSETIGMLITLRSSSVTTATKPQCPPAPAGVVVHSAVLLCISAQLSTWYPRPAALGPGVVKPPFPVAPAPTRQVMSNKQNRTTSMMVVGVLGVLFIIWYLKQNA
jgi:hypothetical protein